MAQKTRELPKAKLEDLEVREVSLVDRPANRRRFLIVKRRSDMPRAAIPASEAEAMALRKQSLEAEPAAADDVSFFDILGIGEVAAAPDSDAPDETSTEPTEGEPAAETPEDHAEGAPDVETPAEGESAPENEPQPEADPEPEPAESQRSRTRPRIPSKRGRSSLIRRLGFCSV